MASTVPAVLTALTALFTTALPDTFQVVEGSLIDVESDFLVVGFDDGDQPAVTGQRVRTGARMGGFRESYEIVNILSLWVGDVETETVRTALFDRLDDLDTVLLADPTIAVPKVTAVTIGTFSFAQPLVAAGSIATLRFTVQVEAFI